MIARFLCAIYGGHDFRCYRRYLVCAYCGKRVSLSEKAE